MKYHCCTENRRNLIETKTNLNGIDYLEIVPKNIDLEKQKTIQLHFIKPLANPIVKKNIIIRNGLRITDIKAVKVTSLSPKAIEIELSDRGNFSIYTLCIRKELKKDQLLDADTNYLTGFDKILSSVDFSFKVECKAELDCKPADNDCAEIDTSTPPEINYLAKDYASFKQLMLDRISILSPGWTERNAADLGITLVEQLAYVADYLSYRQDAISTEAYLGTARKRISVRRHARLVDYHMHDGLNSRAWVAIQIKEATDGVELKRIDGSGSTTKFLTRSKEAAKSNPRISQTVFGKTLTVNDLIFEPLHDLKLFFAHNKMSFHAYGENDCCLPKGSTQATLVGKLDNLKRGQVLILQETLDPETGEEFDANPKHRHAVRLTNVETGRTDFDFSNSPATEIDITIINWDEEDALPFSFCISSTIMKKGKADEIKDVGFAFGNVLLVDQGMSFTDVNNLIDGRPFDTVEGSLHPIQVPESQTVYAKNGTVNPCDRPESDKIPYRYNPVMIRGPITHSETLEVRVDDLTSFVSLPDNGSAKKLIAQDKRKGTPDLTLHEIVKSENTFRRSEEVWQPMQDLLIDSSSQDKHFVLETESDGTAFVRFGNNINGKMPESGSKFIASYRLGKGVIGNVGQDTINQIVSNDPLEIIKINNPLAAEGGIEPETKEEVRQYAPQAFRTQERAVKSEDFETMAKRCKSDIQSVTAAFRWTGSWRTAFITADRLNNETVTAEWESELKTCLEKYRLAGIDLEVDDPHYVGLDIEMEICIKPNYFKIDIRREILDLFSNRVLSNGKLGFFHLNNFVFGQSVYLSSLYALAQNVPGVASVEITKFEKMGVPNSSGIDSGEISFGRQEVARLDNDPNQIEMGVFNLILKGGK